jgi:hypothetical protein
MSKRKRSRKRKSYGASIVANRELDERYRSRKHYAARMAAIPAYSPTRRPRHVSNYTRNALAALEVKRQEKPRRNPNLPPSVAAIAAQPRKCPSKIARRAVLFARKIAGRSGSAPGKRGGYRRKACK